MTRLAYHKSATVVPCLIGADMALRSTVGDFGLKNTEMVTGALAGPSSVSSVGHNKKAKPFIYDSRVELERRGRENRASQPRRRALQHISHMCYTHSAASLPEVQRALFIYISYVALRLML